MNAAISNDLRVYARRRWPLANDKFRKDRLSTLLDISTRRVKSLWEGEASAVIREHEAEAVRRLIGQEEGTRDDLRDLQNRIARLEAALLSQEAGGDRGQVDTIRKASGR